MLSQDSATSAEESASGLIQAMTAAIREKNALDLLYLSSLFASVAGQSDASAEKDVPYAQTPADPQKVRDLAEKFLDSRTAETDCLLRVWSGMLEDESLGSKIIARVGKSVSGGPLWLYNLETIKPVHVVSALHTSGDVETVFLEIETPAEPFTLAVEISHGDAPKLVDVYPVPGDIAYIDANVEDGAFSEHDRSDLSLGMARTWIETAVAASDNATPRLETESWPVLRPLLDWMLRLLPEGTPADRDAVQAAPASSSPSAPEAAAQGAPTTEVAADEEPAAASAAAPSEAPATDTAATSGDAAGLPTDGIAEDVLPRVQELAATTATVAREYFGDESYAQAALAFLAKVAVGDPSIFRRKFKDESTVAALCWVVGKNNDWFGTGDRSIAALNKAAGVAKAPTQRAHTLIAAAYGEGANVETPGGLGDAALVVAA